MRLVSRLDGKCKRCYNDFIDIAYTIVVKTTKIIRYVGDKPDEIKEEHSSTDELCDSCYDYVILAMEEPNLD